MRRHTKQFGATNASLFTFTVTPFASIQITLALVVAPLHHRGILHENRPDWKTKTMNYSRIEHFYLVTTALQS